MRCVVIVRLRLSRSIEKCKRRRGGAIYTTVHYLWENHPVTSSRRDFLKIAAMLSGAAGVSGFVPDSIQRAFAIEPVPGSTYMDAEHIVILMQENRSFDHVLGALQGVRGFNDPRAVRQANGNSVFVQTDAAGNSH